MEKVYGIKMEIFVSFPQASHFEVHLVVVMCVHVCGGGSQCFFSLSGPNRSDQKKAYGG
jgi:hypothetical protein